MILAKNSSEIEIKNILMRHYPTLNFNIGISAGVSSVSDSVEGTKKILRKFSINYIDGVPEKDIKEKIENHFSCATQIFGNDYFDLLHINRFFSVGLLSYCAKKIFEKHGVQQNEWDILSKGDYSYIVCKDKKNEQFFQEIYTLAEKTVLL